jgi:hypothetical protein
MVLPCECLRPDTLSDYAELTSMNEVKLEGEGRPEHGVPPVAPRPQSEVL